MAPELLLQSVGRIALWGRPCPTEKSDEADDSRRAKFESAAPNETCEVKSIQ